LLGELEHRGIDYRGVITGNFIWTAQGPFVIEFNARFGDPEAEVALPLLTTDLVSVAKAVDQRRLESVSIEWSDDWALCVSVAAHGYPGALRVGDVIEGAGVREENSTVFHANTALREGQLVTNGGRVFVVMGRGATFPEARDRAYAAVANIRFAGQHHRSDIGFRTERYLAIAAEGEKR
ncbi:MAG: phosphoribosylglycinamide synthetase C domain-containing protein, partial [Rhodoglobus sp.]